MISFTSKSELIAYNGKYPSDDFFNEALPSGSMRFRSWSKKYVLSPDLEAYALGKTDVIPIKYSLGWVLLAKIARKMHEDGTLETTLVHTSALPDRPRAEHTARIPLNMPEPSSWMRLWRWLGL